MERPTFRNYGGSRQLKVIEPGDLEKILPLKDAHWAVTSVPADVLSCDPAFLAFLDSDGNGRIRTDEFRAGLAWLLRVIGNRARLAAGEETLFLEDINRDDAEGAEILESAGRLLKNLGAAGGEITLAQVRGLKARIASAAFNGDGVIPPEVAGDEDLARFIGDVLKVAGPADDASGRPGVSREKLVLFCDQAGAYLDWLAAGSGPPVLPFGAETAGAAAPLARLADKIDQYFLQCAVVAFDERSAAEMKLRAAELSGMDFSDSALLAQRLGKAPLAPPDPARVLVLDAVTNPLYRPDIIMLGEKTLPLALGKKVSRLDSGQWVKVKSAFAPYRDWQARKPSLPMEQLDPESVAGYLQGTFRERTEKLIARDLAVARDLARIRDLEKLILYQRWFFTLAGNFVNLADLYDPAAASLYEAGKLVIEGREMTFAVRVRDRAAHRKIAGTSHICLLYVEVTAREAEKEESFEVAVPVTSGEFGGLRVGKRGIFIGVRGRVYDARVVDIIVNPVSLSEFIKAPFRQVGAFIGRQVDKFGRSGEERLEKNLAAPAGPGSGLRDIMVGGGIALAALGSSLAYITRALSQVRVGQVFAVLGGVAFLLFVPSIVLGLFRMWRRDLGIVLEAIGCALNVRIRITRAMGRVFTRVPPLPPGARKERRDTVVRLAAVLSTAAGRCRRGFLYALALAVLAAVALLLAAG